MSSRKPVEEPSWCAKPRHDDSEIGMHVSRVLKAGSADRYHGRGEVAVWLERGGSGPTWLTVNVAHMASATVGVSLGEAVKLRDALDVLIRQAANERL